MRALFCLAPLALAACNQPGKPVIVLPPIELTTCADEPPAPDLPPPTQQARRDELTLAYILGLRSAWGSCHAVVDGIKAWREGLSR